MDRFGNPSDQGKKDSSSEKVDSPSLLRQLLEIPKDTTSPAKIAGAASRKRKRPSWDSMLEHSILESSSDGSNTSSVGFKVTMPRSKEMEKYLEIVRDREAKEKLEGSSSSSQEELEELTKGFTPFVWRTSTPKRSEDCWLRFEHVDTPMVQLAKPEEEKDG